MQGSGESRAKYHLAQAFQEVVEGVALDVTHITPIWKSRLQDIQGKAQVLATKLRDHCSHDVPGIVPARDRRSFNPGRKWFLALLMMFDSCVELDGIVRLAVE